MNNISFVIMVLIYSSSIIFESNGGNLVLIVLLLLLYAVNYKKNIRYLVDNYQIFVFFFALYCIITSVWAYDSIASLKVGLSILKTTIVMSLIYIIYIKKHSIKDLVNVIMWSGYLLSFYCIFYYGPTLIYKCLVFGYRLENQKYSNINTMAMVASFSILISIFNYIYVYKKIKISNIFNILNVLLILSSGTRKAIVSLFLGIFLIFLFKNLKRKNIIKNMNKIIVLFIMSLGLYKIFSIISITKGIKNRMNGLIATLTNKGAIDHSTLLRKKYIVKGIETFKNNPLCGIGFDNSYLITMKIENKKTYLHNNYVEILVGGGIIGFILFYIMYIYLFVIFYKYRDIKDKYTNLCVILMILIIILNYGYVSYYYKSTYFYLMIFFIQAKLLKKRKLCYQKKLKGVCRE